MKNNRYVPGIVLLLLLFPVSLVAQNRAEKNLTEPEELYEQLKQSKKSSHKLFAQRWRKLVQRRSWTDQSGKHKTYAKYLEHDPDLKWVKLLVLTGKGKTQTEKEVTVQLAKLDKNGQSVVKRIAIARKKIEEILSVAGKEGRVDARGAAELGFAREGGYQGGVAEGLAVPGVLEEDPVSSREGPMAPEEGDALPRARRPRKQRESQEPAKFSPEVGPREAWVPPGDGFDDNALEARMRGRFQGEQSTREAPHAGLDPNLPDLPDQQPWRTSSQAFSEQLSATRGEDGQWVLDWGEMGALADRYKALLATSRFVCGKLAQWELNPLLIRAKRSSRKMGEIVWKAKIKSPITDPSQAIAFDLPPLPEPFGMVCFCEQENAGDYQRFGAGDQVQFIGRFDGFVGHTLVMRVRFPDKPIESQSSVEAQEEGPRNMPEESSYPLREEGPAGPEEGP